MITLCKGSSNIGENPYGSDEKKVSCHDLSVDKKELIKGNKC
jgi:hypothetical protein